MPAPLGESPCAGAAHCAPVSSDVVCLHCRLHAEQIKRKHVLAGPDRIKHQWEICWGSEPCWLSRLSLLIKGKLPAASVPSKIIVDEYPISGTWCVINPMWSRRGVVGGVVNKKGSVRAWMRPHFTFLTFVLRMFLCLFCVTACDLNVKMSMFRSHQWALPGRHATLRRYLPLSLLLSFQLLSFPAAAPPHPNPAP